MDVPSRTPISLSGIRVIEAISKSIQFASDKNFSLDTSQVKERRKG